MVMEDNMEFYMYTTSVTMKTCGILAPGQTANSGSVQCRSFAEELDSAVIPLVSLQKSDIGSAETPTRVLTAIDKNIQKDLQETFGITPHQPGEPLRSALDSLWPFQKTANGTLSGANMHENAEAAAAIFQKHLSGFIMKQDIATQPPIELSIAGNGKVQVQDGHPDKAVIEEFINGNSELRNLYAGISSTQSMLAMFEETSRFQQRYAADPKAAVEEFAHLFSGKYGYDTRLVIDGSSWEYQSNSTIKIS